MKILIVDDEPLMIDALMSIVDWEGLGFEIVGDACDGEEALKIINTNEVNIVLTDLKMPVMNGLELIRNARIHFPDIKFIVISAYDEFAMVSSAFKLGVEEYILKDKLEQEQVVNVLKNTGAKILEDMEIKKQAEMRRFLEQDAYLNAQRLKQYINRNQGVLREKLLKEIVRGNAYDDNERVRELKDLNIRLNGGRKCIVFITTDDYSRLESEVWEGNGELLNFAILNIMEEVLEYHQIGDVFKYTPGQYAIILCFNNIVSESSIKDMVYVIYDKIRKYIGDYLHINMICGVSSVEMGYKCLKKLLEQAQISCRCAFIYGKESLIGYSSFTDIAIRADNAAMLQEKVAKLGELLKDLDAEKVSEAIPLLCVNNKGILPGNIGDVKLLFEKYYIYISDFVEKNQVNDAAEKYLKAYSEYLREYGVLMDLNNWLTDTLTTLGMVMGESSQLIYRAKKFIHRRYGEFISLADVACELGVSPCYLSRTFTREAGCSLMDYIAKVRVEVAISFMNNTKMRLYEIAEKVGYANVEHFSRMFKKVTGKSPREFMN